MQAEESSQCVLCDLQAPSGGGNPQHNMDSLNMSYGNIPAPTLTTSQQDTL